MRVRWFRRRWRWWLTLILLVLVGIIWLVIINMPTEPVGRLLIERQENQNELFYDYDFKTQQLSIIPPKGITGLDVAFLTSLSKDGKRVAFLGASSNNTRVYIADNLFNTVRAISSGPRDFKPEISPDGSTIIFLRSQGYSTALFAVDVETGVESQLTQYTNDREADWSPDGKRIVFTTSRDGFQELYTMAPDGSDLKRLTNNALQNDLEAQFSPDGKWITYMTNYAVDDGSGEIWLMDADGQHQRRVTDNQQDDRWPKWSPNSRQIVFSRTQARDQRADIFVYDVDDGQIRQLTNNGYSYQPVWSPDSAWIAFSSNPTGSGNQFYIEIMRADGTDRRTLMVGSENIPAGRGFKWTRLEVNARGEEKTEREN